MKRSQITSLSPENDFSKENGKRQLASRKTNYFAFQEYHKTFVYKPFDTSGKATALSVAELQAGSWRLNVLYTAIAARPRVSVRSKKM